MQNTFVAMSVISKITSKGPKQLAEPEKELRFTRSRQAYVFYFSAVLTFALTMSLFILSTQNWGIEPPILQGWVWPCIPGLILVWLLLKLAVRCTRHAYIILSPLGVEIFPFYKAKDKMQMIYWGQIESAEVSDKELVLHYNKEKTGGVVASLQPIVRSRRRFLKKAIEGTMAKREEVAKNSD